MSLIVAWVLFPLVLAAVSAGWGVLVARGSGTAVAGELLIPLGLCAIIAVALLLTEWSVTAPAALPVVVVGAVAGLLLARSWSRAATWPLVAALAILAVYGAPVLLYGQATFTGYIKLDDTSTWLNIVDHAMTNLHAFGPASSTYEQVFVGDIGKTYPLGAFMPLAVVHLLTGIEGAWTIQPYMAFCGSALGLGVYALLAPVIGSRPVRALVAFLAAQPALLYGYSLWGGIKETTGAFLLVLGAALMGQVIVRPANPRGLLPLAVAAAALILTLGVGAAAFVVPALIVLVVVWARRAWPGQLNLLARDLGLLSAVTIVLTLPVWITVSEFLGERASGLFSSGAPTAEDSLGNLIQPLSGWQLAGIWPIGDFRLTAPTVPTVLFVGLVLIGAAGALWITVRRRQLGLATYVAIALIGCAIYDVIGASPWVIGKALAMASPALLAAALTAGALLWGTLGSRRAAGMLGILVVAALAGGVLWSNALGYHDVTLAPRARLAELAHMDGLVAGRGPTFVNEYEVYADRHFLHEGAPVEPADYRPVTLPLRDGAILTKEAGADIDAFPLSTLEPYRSLVTRRSPAESRPPSIYQLVWQGRYYQLWQRPVTPTTHIIEHVPLGESNTLPFCGVSENDGAMQLCSANPVAVPSCALVRKLGRTALAEHAQLLAYSRPAPIIVRTERSEASRWPAAWGEEPSSHTLYPTTPGQLVTNIAVARSGVYELFVNGSFGRGFEVSVDGHSVGSLKNELWSFNAYTPLSSEYLPAGVHTFVLSYPGADLSPGSGAGQFTSLSAIALEPTTPPSRMLEVPPQQATRLCGLSLDWIEIVAPA